MIKNFFIGIGWFVPVVSLVVLAIAALLAYRTIFVDSRGEVTEEMPEG